MTLLSNWKSRITWVGMGLLLAGILMTSEGCGLQFNMTGTVGGAGDGLETISIQNFTNEAPLIVATLAQTFTEKLQDQYISRSRLSLSSGAADIMVSGAITNYSITPMAIASGETAAQNRLTIAVRVNYENNVNEKDSWEQSFSAFADFNSNSDFSSIEQDLIEEVTDQLTQNIFNQSLGKW